MPSIPIVVSPFSAVYVGDAELNTVLTKVFCLRTAGATIEERMEQEYNPATDTWEQSDFHTVLVTLTFLFGDDMTTRLVRGLATTEADLNAPPGEQLYTLLLLHPQTGLKESRYFPKLRTIRSWETNHQKDKGTQYTIQFEAKHRDASVLLMAKHTQAQLKVQYLGARSPY